MQETMNLKAIDWHQLLEVLASFASSETAKDRLLQLQVLPSPQAAIQSFDEIENAKQYIFNEERAFVESIDLFPVWKVRLQKTDLLKAIEFRDVLQFLYETESMRALANDRADTWSQKLIASSYDLSSLQKKIEACVNTEGNIQNTASPKLYELTQEKNQLAQAIQSKLDQIVKKHELEQVLQDRFVTTRDGRWVLPIKYGMQGKFKGIIHDTSRSKQTLFMEPQGVVEANNRIREIEVDINDEIERILKSLTALLKDHFEQLEANADTLLHYDIRLAQAMLANKIDGQSCTFSDDEIKLYDLKNPVLLLQEEKVIANDLQVEQTQSLLLLSGPNAGGKTILLKSLGLAAHMSRCGLPIACSQGSKLPFFENLYISVGDTQNIQKGLSTFAAHLTELKNAYHAYGPKQLILIDEICGSTDPEEGSAIARAYIEHYARAQNYALITSHFSTLKEDWSKDSGVQNASMEYDEASGRATYRLIMGIPGSSFAWKTAKSIGTPEDILERAQSFLNPVNVERQRKIDDMESLYKEALENKRLAEKELRMAEKEKEQIHAKLEEFEKHKEERMLKLLAEKEKELEAFLDQYRGGKVKKSIFEIKAELPKIIKKAEVNQIDTADEFAKRYPAGTKVYAETIQQEALIQSEPNNKGEVSVLSNSMRLSIHWKFLLKKVDEKKQEHISKGKALASHELVIDLRGFSVEEAMEKVEKEIDHALQQDLDRIKIIHGHGTGSLKKAIRNQLSRNSLVNKWQAAREEHGGDGVTWVMF